MSTVTLGMKSRSHLKSVKPLSADTSKPSRRELPSKLVWTRFALYLRLVSRTVASQPNHPVGTERG